METEKIRVCDENGQSLGVAARQEIHQKGLWHETFHCWIVSGKSGKSKIHLQLRSKEKKDFANLFDITAAGHILADETVEDGLREVEEELGIKVSFEELIPLGVIKDQIQQKDFIDNERCHVFLYKAAENLDATYKLQKEEVAGIVAVEFAAFYDLCCGVLEAVEASGFEVLENGEKTEVNKTVSLRELVPHSSEYLQDVARLIKGHL